ncbi:MAG: hypothetical protein SFX73_12735 [Kofleriaceae bacterium]|nr:hypothetical protein [Kofleriaceae bacterium]
MMSTVSNARYRVAVVVALAACGTGTGSGTGRSTGTGTGAGAGAGAGMGMGMKRSVTFGATGWRTGNVIWGISYNGEELVVGSNGVTAFSRVTGERLQTLDLARPAAREKLDQVIDGLASTANLPAARTSATAVAAMGPNRYAVVGGDKLQVIDLGTGRVEATTAAGAEGSDPLAVSRDRTRIAFRQAPDVAALWTPATGDVRILGTFARVTGIAIAPGGNTVYVADRHGVYGIVPGQQTRVTRALESAHTVLAANDRFVVSAAGARVRFLDPQTLAVRHTCAVPDQVWQIAIADDDRVAWASDREVGTCTPDGTMTTLAKRLTRDMPHAIAWSPSGDEIAVGNDTRVELYAVKDGTDRAASQHGADIVTIAIDPAGTRVATGDAEGGVQIWDRATGKGIRTVRPPDGTAIQALQVTPTGLVIAERDGHVWLDDGAREVWRIRPGGRFPMGLALSPDGARLAIDHGEETATRGVTIVDVKTGAIASTIVAERSYQLVWRPRTLWGRTGRAMVAFDVDAGRAHERFALPTETTTLAITEDGKRAVTCEASGECQVRALPSGSISHRAHLTKHRIRALALAPDASWAAVGSLSGELAIWRLEKAAPEVVHQHANGTVVVAIAPDGTSIVSGGSDTTAVLWEAPR